MAHFTRSTQKGGQTNMNTIYHHPGQPQMQAQAILASKGPEQEPIYTIRMRYPRIIHAEGKTHRMTPFRTAIEEDISVMDDTTLSRNAGSSRARPAKVTIQEVRDTPFIPWHWGKNQSGMQATEENNNPVWLYPKEPCEREHAWQAAAKSAADAAQAFADSGYHKQVFNRLLEPFSWIDVLATGTASNWKNFLWLRDHEDAEPHIADLAVLVGKAMKTCEIQNLSHYEWHLPYITESDLAYATETFCDEYLTKTKEGWDFLLKVSAARCARISYAPFGSKEPNIEADLDLYEKLVGNARIHASPMEHQATPDTPHDEETWDNPQLHGNLNGWIQFRQTIPNQKAT